MFKFLQIEANFIIYYRRYIFIFNFFYSLNIEKQYLK